MKVLLAGASGFLGGRLLDALAADGHDVVAAGRRPPPGWDGRAFVAVDFAAAPPPQWWTPHLAGVDVVINAVGILREVPRQGFDRLHTDAPRALFEAAAAAGVRLVV